MTVRLIIVMFVEVTKSLVIHADTSLSLSALSLTLDSPHKEIAIVKDMNLSLMKYLGSIIPWSRDPHSPILPSASRTPAALSVILPANEPGQHDIPSPNLSILRAGIRDSMGLAFYLISNNLSSGYDDGDKNGYFESMERDDILYLQILKDIGWDDLHHLRILLSSCEPTVESITERLFAAALRSDNFEIANKMLRAGMNPNIVFEQFMEGFEDQPFLTPLQYLLASAHLSPGGMNAQSIDLLISHGADVNFSVNDSGRNALFYAVAGEFWTTVRLLLNNGATVTRQCVALLIEDFHNDHEELDVVKDMIGIYLDQSVATQQDETKTLLPAIREGHVDIVKLFIAKGARINGLAACSSYGESCQTSLLGWAVKKKVRDIIRLLLRVSPPEDLSLIHPPYISPLALAVNGGFVDICEDLLTSGADLRATDEGQQTLLERAVWKKSLSLCQMLINHGARVDRDPQEAQWFPSALMIAVQQDSMDIVDLLIASNARLNDAFKRFPCAILTVAIDSGNVAMIEKLENAGATRLGLEIRRIGNLQTALLLENRIYFQRILYHFGSSILTAAIFARDEPLVWFLLQRIARLNQPTTITVGNMPLLAAIRTKNFALVLPLLERGVLVTDHVLTDAVLSGNIAILPILLPRLLGNAPTAVSAAVLQRSTKYLKILREANVDFKEAPQISYHLWGIHLWGMIGRSCVSDDYSCLESTLEIATFMADESMFKYLLEWAASVPTNWCQNSVARALTLAIVNEKPDRIFDLMQLDSNMNCSMTLGRSSSSASVCKGTFTPLQAAVRTQRVSVVRDLLILKRADVNYLGDGKLRRTPLQHAVELGNMEIFGLLLKHGADVNAPAADDGGATALQIAAIKGFIGIARKLLDLGADVNQAPAIENGRTALGGAAEYGRIDMLQMLLNKGALVVGEYEDQYLTAVKLAEDRGHYAAAKLLRSFKESVELGA
ncbi:unnamed protein product [Penicillium olsonii]|nr:unnamed protein product [Penicillium olsonii]